MTDTFTIPLASVESQVLAVTLGNQPCRIDVFQKSTGLYLDLHVADRPIVLGVACRDRVPLVLSGQFTGDLSFYDTQGEDDPYYDELGSRWQLLWLS